MQDIVPNHQDSRQAEYLAHRIRQLDPDLLRGIDDGAMISLASQMQLRTMTSAREVLTQGEPTRVAFLVLDGRVEVSFINIDGNKVLAHVAQPGEVIGEVEILSGLSCAATCLALQNSTLAIFSAQVLHRCIEPEKLLGNFARIFHARLVRDNRQQTVAMYYPAEERVRSHLLTLTTPEHPEAIISQSKLAAFAGCSRQTVNKTLAQLRAEKTIELGRGVIRVLDRNRLQQTQLTPDKDGD